MREIQICHSCKREYLKSGDFLVGTGRWRRSAAGHYWFSCTCGAVLAIPSGHLTWFMPLSILGPGAIGSLSKSEEEQVLDAVISCAGCDRCYASSWDVLSGTNRLRLCSSGHLWFNCGCGCALYIPSSQCDWYNAESQMGTSAKAVYAALPDKTLIPRMPSTLSHAQEVVTNPTSSALEIAAAVKQDPLVAAELLRLADLHVVSKGNRVKSIEHAVVMVGRQSIADLITASAIKVMPIRTKAFSSNFFWREAILVGKIAERLGQDLISDIPGDQVYLAGALCNIGKLLAAMVEPEALDKVFLAAIDPDAGTNWTDAENKCFGTSRLVLGEIAARLWGLPEFVCGAISRHHPAEPFSKDSASISEVVALAIDLSHRLSGNTARQSRRDGQWLAKRFDLDHTKLTSLANVLQRDVVSTLQNSGAI